MRSSCSRDASASAGLRDASPDSASGSAPNRSRIRFPFAVQTFLDLPAHAFGPGPGFPGFRQAAGEPGHGVTGFAQVRFRCHPGIGGGLLLPFDRFQAPGHGFQAFLDFLRFPVGRAKLALDLVETLPEFAQMPLGRGPAPSPVLLLLLHRREALLSVGPCLAHARVPFQ